MLLLGNDVSDGFRAALQELLDEVDTWGSLSRCTDFDAYARRCGQERSTCW